MTSSELHWVCILRHIEPGRTGWDGSVTEKVTEALVDVHPLAAEILRAIAINERDPERSSIPAEALRRYTARLRAQTEDRRLFEHLCVMFARLEKGGLPIAAKQVLSLAKLGVPAAKLTQTIDRAERAMRGARDAEAGPQATKGLARTRTDMGIRIRPRGR